MNANTREPIRLIQNGLDQLGHSPGAIDGLWGLRTARAMKALLAANGHAAAVAPPVRCLGLPRQCRRWAAMKRATALG